MKRTGKALVAVPILVVLAAALPSPYAQDPGSVREQGFRNPPGIRLARDLVALDQR